VQFPLQCSAGGGDLGKQLFVFRQTVVYIAGAGVGIVRVLEVKLKVASFDPVDGRGRYLLVFQADLISGRPL